MAGQGQRVSPKHSRQSGLSRRGGQVAGHPASSGMERHDRRIAGVPHPQTAIRSRAWLVDSRVALRADQTFRQTPRRAQCQRPRWQGQGGGLQTVALHQPGQAWYDRVERRVDRYGAVRQSHEPLSNEPNGSVRHGRHRAVFSEHEQGPRHPSRASERRPDPSRRCRSVRRRVADDFYQLAR